MFESVYVTGAKEISTKSDTNRDCKVFILTSTLGFSITFTRENNRKVLVIKLSASQYGNSLAMAFNNPLLFNLGGIIREFLNNLQWTTSN